MRISSSCNFYFTRRTCTAEKRLIALSYLSVRLSVWNSATLVQKLHFTFRRACISVIGLCIVNRLCSLWGTSGSQRNFATSKITTEANGGLCEVRVEDEETYDSLNIRIEHDRTVSLLPRYGVLLRKITERTVPECSSMAVRYLSTKLYDFALQKRKILTLIQQGQDCFQWHSFSNHSVFIGIENS